MRPRPIDVRSPQLPDAPLVSVWMVSCNHAPFIDRAIASVIAQQTPFPFELVIGDDASSDGTREIVLDWQRRHPDRIRVRLHERNVGPRANGMDVLHACRGRYVAMLEGDDYWVDPEKLRLQAELLEAHPDAILCGARAAVADTDGGMTHVTPAEPPDELATWGARELFEGRWWFRTCTKMIPRRWMERAPQRLGRDWAGTLWLIAASDFGRVCFLDRTVAVYRRHAGGIWSGASDAGRAISDVRTLYDVLPYFHGADRRHLEQALRQRVKILFESPGVSHTTRLTSALRMAMRIPRERSSWRAIAAAFGAGTPFSGENAAASLAEASARPGR